MSDKSHVLYVRNISNRASAEDIRRCFSKYGSIYDVNLPLDYYSRRMKGYAFIEFNHSSDAKEAHRKLDRTDFMGRVIEIEFARGVRRTPAEMMRLEGGRSGGGWGDGGDGRDGRDKRDRRRSRSRSRTRSRSHSPHGAPNLAASTTSSSRRRRRTRSPSPSGAADPADGGHRRRRSPPPRSP